MDVDEQLEDAFEAAFAEDDAVVVDEAPTTAVAPEGQGAQNGGDFQ